MTFTFYKQLNKMSCGPTCLRMIAKYYGKHFNVDIIKDLAGYGKNGVSLLGISTAAEKIGFRTRGVHITIDQLINEAHLPCILHWDQKHFVVLVSANKPFFKSQYNFTIADPAKGITKFSQIELSNNFIRSKNEQNEGIGIALLLQPTPKFYETEGDNEMKFRWSHIFRYLKQSKGKIIQVILALSISSLLQLIFPFLTQSIVDIGISTHNLNFITIILLAQLTGKSTQIDPLISA